MIAVVVSVPLVVVVILVVPVEVSVVVMVPMMVVFNATVVSVPVADEIMAAFIVWPHPDGSFIWRAGPVTCVPFVVIADRIPIAFDPHEIWRWCWRRCDIHGCRGWRRLDLDGRWRCANRDANGNLRPDRRDADQQCPGKQGCSHEGSHRISSLWLATES